MVTLCNLIFNSSRVQQSACKFPGVSSSALRRSELAPAHPSLRGESSVNEGEGLAALTPKVKGGDL